MDRINVKGLHLYTDFKNHERSKLFQNLLSYIYNAIMILKGYIFLVFNLCKCYYFMTIFIYVVFKVFPPLISIFQYISSLLCTFYRDIYDNFIYFSSIYRFFNFEILSETSLKNHYLLSSSHLFGCYRDIYYFVYYKNGLHLYTVFKNHEIYKLFQNLLSYIYNAMIILKEYFFLVFNLCKCYYFMIIFIYEVFKVFLLLISIFQYISSLLCTFYRDIYNNFIHFSSFYKFFNFEILSETLLKNHYFFSSSHLFECDFSYGNIVNYIIFFSDKYVTLILQFKLIFFNLVCNSIITLFAFDYG